MGAAYAIIYLGYAACVVAAFVVIVFLFFKRFYALGAIALFAGLAFAILPAITSQIEGRRIAAAAAELSFAPDAIDFAGKRVVFAETEFTICDSGICDYALRHGGLAEVYWTPATNLPYEAPDAAGPFAAMESLERFYRIELSAVDEYGMRLPEPVAEGLARPEVDYTVLVDDSWLHGEYPQAFDVSADVSRTVRFMFAVYEGWPDDGQAPIARLLTAQYHTDPALIWPVSTDFNYAPPLFTHRDQVRGWFCAAPMPDPIFGPDAC